MQMAAGKHPVILEKWAISTFYMHIKGAEMGYYRITKYFHFIYLFLFKVFLLVYTRFPKQIVQIKL